MRKFFLLSSLFFITSSTLIAFESLKGSGASFPYSVYTSWINKYYQETGIKIEYISKGSSKGIEDAKLRAVDFAGTDKPLNEKQLHKYKLLQFPAVVGATTLGYNLPGIQKLNIKRIFIDWACDNSGATAIEYGLMAALIALSIISGATAFSTALNAQFNEAAKVMTDN